MVRIEWALRALEIFGEAWVGGKHDPLAQRFGYDHLAPGKSMCRRWCPPRFWMALDKAWLQSLRTRTHWAARVVHASQGPFSHNVKHVTVMVKSCVKGD